MGEVEDIQKVIKGESGGCIVVGDCLDVLKDMPSGSVHCVVTSPPYWGLRSYLPDKVQLRKDTSPEVIKELESLGIYPVDGTGE